MGGMQYLVLDEFFLPVYNPEEAILVHGNNVTSLKPSIRCDAILRC